ncbi:MAG: outer membrane beta-barrel protein [Pseudomonadota bacterium]
MNIARTAGLRSLVTLAALTSPLIATAADVTGWYLGANVGRSLAKIDDARISSSLLGSGFASVTIDDDDRDAGYKIFGGYQFNRYFAMEGGYFDLGKFGFAATTVPAGRLNGTIALKGVNLDLVGRLPLTEKFSVFGRVGVNHAQARDNFSGTGAVAIADSNPRKRDTNVKFGAGLQYDFTDAFGVRAEIERYRVNDAIGNKGDVDLASIGLIYRFGAPAPRAVEQVAAAPTPMPAPVVVVPAPAPAPVPPTATKISFAADALFDFNKATLKSEGKLALDKLANDLKGTRFDLISIIGHTDRIGSKAYNLKLSASRAEAVKTYLISQAGISAAAIATKGINGDEPVTQPGDCKGSKPTKQLIACLAPDRRVEVEVTASR